MRSKEKFENQVSCSKLLEKVAVSGVFTFFGRASRIKAKIRSLRRAKVLDKIGIKFAINISKNIISIYVESINYEKAIQALR
jgi:hypothetical protein